MDPSQYGQCPYKKGKSDHKQLDREDDAKTPGEAGHI